jgi:hypothetical protein
MANVKGGGAIRLNYTDLCGTAKIDGVTVYSSCPPAFSIAPNPAQSNITVSMNAGADINNAAAKSASAPIGKIFQIKITDGLAVVRKLLDYKVPLQSVTISITGLEAGIYSVSIFDGTVWSTQKLIVQ